MWRTATAAIVLIGLCGSPLSFGALSANLIQHAGFEPSPIYPFRVTPTPNGIPPGRFDPEYDLGKWLATDTTPPLEPWPPMPPWPSWAVSDFDDPRH